MSAETDLFLMIVGSSHRTHAVAQVAAESDVFKRIYVAGSNAGAELIPKVRLFTCPEKPDDLLQFMWKIVPYNQWVMWIDSEKQIKWAGDTFRNHGVHVAAPPMNTLGNTEESKAHGSMLCDRARVPTPRWLPLREDELDKGLAYLERLFRKGAKGCVVEFDGLADGKGVTVCATLEEATEALNRILVERKFGPPTYGPYWAVIEDLAGGTEERSALAATFGSVCTLLPLTADYKRRYNGNTGPMTGSMGCTMNQADQHPQTFQLLMSGYFQPLIAALGEIGCMPSGFLYPALMKAPSRSLPDEVLELNYRLPGPEALPIIMWYGKKFVYFLLQAAGVEPLDCIPEDWLRIPTPSDLNEDFVCITVADRDYPVGKARGGDLIEGLEPYLFQEDENPTVMVFLDGVVRKDGKFYTKKGAGRVLFVVVRGANPAEAYDRAYEALASITFHNMGFRTDVGLKAKQDYLATLVS